GVRELVLMSSAVIIGVSVALGFAELWIGHINAQTAFLGAIIAGTGINYAIIFLDRYRRNRATMELDAALESACAQPLHATGIAAGFIAATASDVVQTNLRELGTRSSETSGIQKLDNRLRAMDDRSATPAVIATDRRDETRPICDVLNHRAKTDLVGIMYRCY